MSFIDGSTVAVKKLNLKGTSKETADGLMVCVSIFKNDKFYFSKNRK